VFRALRQEGFEPFMVARGKRQAEGKAGSIENGLKGAAEQDVLPGL
jgi:hypothetical protein